MVIKWSMMAMYEFFIHYTLMVWIRRAAWTIHWRKHHCISGIIMHSKVFDEMELLSAQELFNAKLALIKYAQRQL